MRVVRKITYDGSDVKVRRVVNNSLPDGICDFTADPRITCETVEGAPPDPALDVDTFGDERHALGLKVDKGKIAITDLITWIEARDAGCAEYLAPALYRLIETGDDVEE